MRHQHRAVKTAYCIDKAARKRVVTNGYAHRCGIGILHQAAGHFYGLQCFVSVVKVECRKWQHHRAQRGHLLGVGSRVEQHQLACGVAQLGGNLGLVFFKSVLVVAVAALFFVLQHGQSQANRCQCQQQKCTAKKHPQAQWHACR